MDQQGSFLNTATGMAPPPGTPIAVRPLSTGEVLDRTFVLYRRNFWLFAGIGAVPSAVLTVSAVLRVIYLAATHRSATFTPGAAPDAVASAMGNMMLVQAYFLPALLIFYVAYGLSHAASMVAVSRLSRGITLTAAEAYRAIQARWLRWVGVALRQFWSFLWPILPVVALFAGLALWAGRTRGNAVAAGALALVALLALPAAFVCGVINFLRNSLSMPAAVLENLRVNAAMRRSRALAAGHKARIFLALLLVYALHMVAGGIQVPMVLLALRARGAEHVLLQAVQLLVQFVVTTLVTPVASIALCLLYVDERVRREGYDIELLMERSFAASSPGEDTPMRAGFPETGNPA